MEFRYVQWSSVGVTEKGRIRSVNRRITTLPLTSISVVRWQMVRIWLFGDLVRSYFGLTEVNWSYTEFWCTNNNLSVNRTRWRSVTFQNLGFQASAPFVLIEHHLHFGYRVRSFAKFGSIYSMGVRLINNSANTMSNENTKPRANTRVRSLYYVNNFRCRCSFGSELRGLNMTIMLANN